MAQAPQVQSLAQIMNDLTPSIQGQQDLITQQQNALPGKYNSQRTALNAEKVRGFNDINTQATGRGVAFSGIPLDEQATYLSTKYLPGLQAIDQQQNDEFMDLSKQSAALYSSLYDKAFDERSKQQSALNSWNLTQMQIEADAKQKELDRQAAAREAAADRAANAPKNLSPNDAALAVINGAISNGADVSANVFQLARDAYRRAGGDVGKFASDFWKYVPQSANQDNSASGWKAYYYG